MKPTSKISDKLIVPTSDSDQPFIVYELQWPHIRMGKAKITDLVANHQFYEDIKSGSINIDLQRACINEHIIFDLGPCEVINSHQWEGREPIEIKDAKGELTGRKEPACWDVASVNVATGERLLIVRTHANKDEVFRISNRMNIVLNYVRELCGPWEDIIRDKENININELQTALSDHPPSFGFDNISTMDMSGNKLSDYKNRQHEEQCRNDDPAKRFIPKVDSKISRHERQAKINKILLILVAIAIIGILFITA